MLFMVGGLYVKKGIYAWQKLITLVYCLLLIIANLVAFVYSINMKQKEEQPL